MHDLIWSEKGLTNKEFCDLCKSYFEKAFSSYGIKTYDSEFSSRSNDFEAKTKIGILKFKVRSLCKGSYTYVQAKQFNISDESLYITFALFVDGKQPFLYLIPATAWKNNADSKLFVYRPYEGKKSAPEYGIYISDKNMSELETYRFEKMIETIL